MTELVLSLDIVGQWIERRMAVQLDPAGQHFVKYQALMRVIERGVNNIIEILVASSMRMLWDLLHIRDGYTDHIIGEDSYDHIHVRRYAEVEAEGHGTDDSIWMVIHEDTPVTDPPIPFELS